MSATIRGTETANTRATATAAASETAWAWSTTSTSTAVIGTPASAMRLPGWMARASSAAAGVPQCKLSDGRLGRASLVRGALPVTPGRESLRLSDRAVRTGSLPQSRNDTRFVSRQQPARVDRVPFEDQRRGIDQMTRSTFGNQRSPAVNNTGPAGRSQGTSGVQRGAGSAASQGWRQGGGNAPAGNSAGAGNSGWRRFSGPRRGFRTKRRRNAAEPPSRR